MKLELHPGLPYSSILAKGMRLLVLLVSTLVASAGLAQIVKLPSQVNRAGQSELAPVISADGMTLYFTRGRESLDSNVVFDIWRTTVNADGTFTPAEVVAGNLASRFGIAVTSVSPDNNVLYLMGKMYEATPPDERIYRSQLDMGGWSIPKPVKIRDLRPRGTFTDYSFGPDQRTLVMSLERDSSIGGRDLYVSFFDEQKNEWSAPLWLGPRVNSNVDDITPFLAADRKTLYFSSERPDAIGACDVYRVVRKDESWQNWTLPENLGPSVNRLGRTMYYTEDAKGEYAYFVWRKDEYSYADIYRSKITRKRPIATALIAGRVTDVEGKPLQALVRYERLRDGKLLGYGNSNPASGAYQVTLPKGELYAIRAEKDGFIATSESIMLDTVQEFTSATLDLVLTPLRRGVTVRLNNIFFETDRSELLPSSIPELERLKSLLESNPTISIQIEGHTDAEGSTARNLELSKARAQAVKDYLLRAGIVAARIKEESFGASRPLAGNDTEEGRAKNRRVEFRILEVK